MTRVEWEGIPEAYWPDTDKPWRVSWGFGAFEDFATEAEAERAAAKLRRELPADWPNTVHGPFNAVTKDGRCGTHGEKDCETCSERDDEARDALRAGDC